MLGGRGPIQDRLPEPYGVRRPHVEGNGGAPANEGEVSEGEPAAGAGNDDGDGAARETAA